MDNDGMDKRALIAVVLSIVVLILYQIFFMPSPPQQQPPVKKRPVQPPVDTSIVEEKPQKLLKVQQEGTSRFIVVETPLYRAVLSTQGATIKEWILKKYLDDNGNQIKLTPDQPRVPPLSIGFTEAFSLSKAIFQTDAKDQIEVTEGERAVTFYFTQNDITVRRTFHFYADHYKVDVEEEVKGRPNYWVTLGSGLGISGTYGYGGHIGPVVLQFSDRIEIKPEKLMEPKIFREGLRWVAQEDKYFFSSIVPPEGSVAKIWRDERGPLVAVNLSEETNRYILYIGPKEHDRLKTLGVGLEHIIDFGFFSILARPLFWILKFFYKLVGNYGWAIVLLTIVTRIPFIPLMNRGQKSIKKLQALQPKMNEIREKYKKDPKKMQEEMMKLYRQYKVNPMSGCLPMLIQIPVFFALYKVLLIAIELRGAPFILWIDDLSKKDPYYILPIVMGITMYIQQRMTPTPADTSQQKFMKFLPLIFTFLFLNFPSGLVLYWLVSNILSIIQQWYVNKKAEA